MQKKINILFLLIFSLFTLNAFADHFSVLSSDFTNNSILPSQFTCDGQNISPALSWQDPPKNTQSFVLIMDDPDAANGTLTHWIIFNIPATTTALATNTPLPEGAISGMNSWEKPGYSGPCPPKGSTHHYLFTLYALKKPLTVNSNVHKDDILNAMKGLILKKARIVGIYQK